VKRILVVEDTEDNRQIVRDLLTSVGYELIEAVDGEAGVAAALREKPDLILMDIQLPLRWSASSSGDRVRSVVQSKSPGEVDE
jgi:CheY-like chemotaxis protein